MTPGFKPARKHYTHQKIDGIEHCRVCPNGLFKLKIPLPLKQTERLSLLNRTITLQPINASMTLPEIIWLHELINLLLSTI